MHKLDNYFAYISVLTTFLVFSKLFYCVFRKFLQLFSGDFGF